MSDNKLSTDIKTLSMNAMGWAERAEAIEKQVKKYEGLETTLKPLTLIELVKAFNEICQRDDN